MAQRIKDAWGNEYEKDPNGSYKDFWGTRYSPVSGGGSTLLGFLLIGYVIYTSFRIIRKCLLGLSQRL